MLWYPLFTTMIIFFFQNDDVPRHSHGTHRWESLLSARMTVFEHEISFHCLFLSQIQVYFKECLTQIPVLKRLEDMVVKLNPINSEGQIISKICRVFCFWQKLQNITGFSFRGLFDSIQCYFENLKHWCCLLQLYKWFTHEFHRKATVKPKW